MSIMPPPFCPYVWLSVCLFVGLFVRLVLSLSGSLSLSWSLCLCLSEGHRDRELGIRLPEQVRGEEGGP